MNKLTTGRTVLYKLSQADCDRIIRHRSAINAQLHSEELICGNTPHPGDVVPAIVVTVWADDTFNGQAILDGNQSVWLCTVPHDQDGKRPGTWHWPEFSAHEGHEETRSSTD